MYSTTRKYTNQQTFLWYGTLVLTETLYIYKLEIIIFSGWQKCVCVCVHMPACTYAFNAALLLHTFFLPWRDFAKIGNVQF